MRKIGANTQNMTFMEFVDILTYEYRELFQSYHHILQRRETYRGINIDEFAIEKKIISVLWDPNRDGKISVSEYNEATKNYHDFLSALQPIYETRKDFINAIQFTPITYDSKGKSCVHYLSSISGFPLEFTEKWRIFRGNP
jgi:hypothetical protein